MTLAGCHWLLLALTIGSHWLSFALTGSHWPSPLALIIGPQALLKAAARDVYHTGGSVWQQDVDGEASIKLRKNAEMWVSSRLRTIFDA